MYLFYVTATELKGKQREEVEGVHAIFANDEDHLTQKCTELFVKFNPPSSKHQLSPDWD